MDKKIGNNGFTIGVIVIILFVCVTSIYVGYKWGEMNTVKQIPSICSGVGYVPKDFTNGVINLTNDLIDYINEEHNATLIQHLNIIK